MTETIMVDHEGHCDFFGSLEMPIRHGRTGGGMMHDGSAKFSTLKFEPVREGRKSKFHGFWAPPPSSELILFGTLLAILFLFIEVMGVWGVRKLANGGDAYSHDGREKNSD